MSLLAIAKMFYEKREEAQGFITREDEEKLKNLEDKYNDDDAEEPPKNLDGSPIDSQLDKMLTKYCRLAFIEAIRDKNFAGWDGLSGVNLHWRFEKVFYQMTRDLERIGFKLSFQEEDGKSDTFSVDVLNEKERREAGPRYYASYAQGDPSDQDD